MSRLKRFARLINSVNDVVGRVIALLLIPITVIIVYSVVLRYLFNRATAWSWDVSLELFGFVILLGVGYTLLHGKHIRIDIVTASLPARARKVVELVALAVILLIAVILLWQGGIESWGSLLQRERLSTSWAPYVFPLKMMLPVAAVLLILQVIAQAIHLLLPPTAKGE